MSTRLTNIPNTLKRRTIFRRLSTGPLPSYLALSTEDSRLDIVEREQEIAIDFVDRIGTTVSLEYAVGVQACVVG